MRKCCLHAGMHVDEIERTGPCVLQNAEVVPHGKWSEERPQGAGSGMIAAREVCSQTEPRLQRQRDGLVSRLRGESPRADMRRPEIAKLPDIFVVKVPPAG